MNTSIAFDPKTGLWLIIFDRLGDSPPCWPAWATASFEKALAALPVAEAIVAEYQSHQLERVWHCLEIAERLIEKFGPGDGRIEVTGDWPKIVPR